MYVGVFTDPPWGARRLTAQPADPQGLGQPRGGVPSPPPFGGLGSSTPTAPQNYQTSFGVRHWLAAARVPAVLGVQSTYLPTLLPAGSNVSNVCAAFVILHSEMSFAHTVCKHRLHAGCVVPVPYRIQLVYKPHIPKSVVNVPLAKKKFRRYVKPARQVGCP